MGELDSVLEICIVLFIDIFVVEKNLINNLIIQVEHNNDSSKSGATLI